MMRRSDTAVVERNWTWSGAFATEPYEAGWAGEAIFFVRALKVVGTPGTASARVQISPDGIRWCDEGTTVPLPSRDEGVTFARVRHFGGWLRLAGELPAGLEIRVLVTLSLKE